MPFEDLDELICQQIKRDRLPGLAIALVKDDEIVWSRGCGYANLETKAPVTPSTVFSIQSVTKTIIATAVMQWVERGALVLDAPVNEYLAPLRVENQWESEAPVTLRGLLTHSAGLPVAFNPPGTPDNPATLEKSIEVLGKTERRPAERIAYANIGYLIAGWLLGKLAGKRYDEALRESVLEPLDMCSTALPDKLGDGLRAQGYYRSVIDGELYEGDDRWPTMPADPAGGLCSTVEDLARFLIAHVNRDEQVLSDDSYAAMHSLQVEINGSEHGMGLGFRVAQFDGRKLICHGGDGFGFTDFIGAFPGGRSGVALLISMGRAHEARATIGNAALRKLASELAPRSLRNADASLDLRSFAGRYQSSFWAIDADVSIDNGSASVTVTPSLTVPFALTSTLEPLAGDHFRATGGFFDGWELAFGRTADGTPMFSGGLYPWTFTRTGDTAPEREQRIDESVDVVGRWAGKIESPMGGVPATLTISSSSDASIDAMTARGKPVRSFQAESGRVDGDFAVELPSLGRFDVFLRLVASDGRLIGTAYARGGFGEVPMPTTLERES